MRIYYRVSVTLYWKSYVQFMLPTNVIILVCRCQHMDIDISYLILNISYYGSQGTRLSSQN